MSSGGGVAARGPGSVGRGSLVHAVAAEAVGMYIKIFIGTGAVVAFSLSAPDDPASAVGIALAFGFAVLVPIYALGHVSGAHINPSVTIGLAAARRFPLKAVPAYLIAQLVGAFLASLTVWALFGAKGRGADVALGATTPGDGVSAGVALLAEIVITFILLIVVMGTAVDDRADSPAVGLGVGLVIAAGIFVTLKISGGSFDAFRSLAPAVLSGSYDAIWVYLVGPIVGAVGGALVYELGLRPGKPPTQEGAVEEQP